MRFTFNLQWVAVSGLAGAATYVATFSTFRLVQMCAGLAENIYPAGPSSNGWLYALWVAGVSPLLEEFLFRVILLGRIFADVRPAKAIILSTIVFTAAHTQYYAAGIDWADIASTFTLGALCGIAYLKSRRLLLPFVMHAINNTIILVPKPALYSYLAAGGNAMRSLQIVVALVAAILLFFRVCRVATTLRSSESAEGDKGCEDVDFSRTPNSHRAHPNTRSLHTRHQGEHR